MKLALFAILVIAACKNPKQEQAPAPVAKPSTPSAAEPAAPPSPPAVEAPAAGPAQPDSPAVVLDDNGKHGVVELTAVDDLSGRTKGTFKVVRHCGAAAVAAVEKIGKQLADRAKAGTHDPVSCTETAGSRTCVQGGNGEGDTALEVVYKSDAGAWRVIGVKTYAMGVTMDAQDKQFDKLVAGSCK